jgi:glutamate racemase
MDKRPVVFIDSGIGSLPYGNFFHKNNPAENIVYAADRAHFPYGARPKEEVVEILRALVSKLIGRWNPKVVAVACNTASVSALPALRETFPALPFVGTVPAVKPAVLASKKRRVGVLGTERTIDDPYINELAAKYGPDCEIVALAAPELVEFVERRYVSSSHGEKLEAVRPWIEKFHSAGADGIVLGCTHFLLLLDEFREAAKEVPLSMTTPPSMTIFDSVEGVSRRVESLLDGGGGKLRAPASSTGNKPLLVITGAAPPEPYWTALAETFDLELGLIE